MCENFSNLNIKDKLTNSFQPPYEFKCVKAHLSENTKLIVLTSVTHCSWIWDLCQEPWDPLLLLEYLKHTASNLWHKIFPVATASCFWEKVSLWWAMLIRKKTSWFSAVLNITRPVN